jgi:ketosteroid isomerase-like protein
MITAAEAMAWITAYGEAWTTQDPDKIVRLFTADAGYRERRFHPGLRGHAEIHDYWQFLIHDLQHDIGFEVVSVAVSGDMAYINWRSHFSWRPINGILELDALSRTQFSSESLGGIRLASEFEEWIDHREA